MGLFSTRSPHRPNPIGLSIAKVESIDIKRGILELSGIDLVAGTPVLDIKPYVPGYDAVPGATFPDWIKASLGAANVPVEFTEVARGQLAAAVLGEGMGRDAVGCGGGGGGGVGKEGDAAGEGETGETGEGGKSKGKRRSSRKKSRKKGSGGGRTDFYQGDVAGMETLIRQVLTLNIDSGATRARANKNKTEKKKVKGCVGDAGGGGDASASTGASASMGAGADGEGKKEAALDEEDHCVYIDRLNVRYTFRHTPEARIVVTEVMEVRRQ